MCGIFFFAHSKEEERLPARTLEMLYRIQHRGPDETQIRHFTTTRSTSITMAFHRLAVRDVSHNGMQPFEHNGLFCLANGEIWNSEELKIPGYPYQSQSDCEVILPLFNYHRDLVQMVVNSICKKINGEYAFVIYDSIKNKVYVATDQLSVRPLFIMIGPDGLGIASEAKALIHSTTTIDISLRQNHKIYRLPVASWAEFDLDNLPESPTFHNYFNWTPQLVLRENPAADIRHHLTKSVRTKLTRNMHREYAFLLSGGLDSSLVCSIATRILRETNPTAKIRTFTIALVESLNDMTNLPEDIVAARKVAKFLNTDHTELVFTMQQALNTIPRIIYTTETWDQTTIRASTPMYLGVHEIKRRHPEIAVIFSGEVADELLQGYLYNHTAPSAQAGREDAIKLLKNIHTFDGLRADRVVASAGCELRLPFFDPELLKYVLETDPKVFNPNDQNNIEKFILREAFEGYLPEDVLWRTKQALSDASSHKSGWKDFIKKNIPHGTEDEWYMSIFTQTYMNYWNLVPYKWMPPKEWINSTDSSAATLNIPGLIFRA